MSETFEPVDVAVVGGGISGLACAFWVQSAGRTVALFEASGDVGGSITTVRDGAYVADGGPQSFMLSDALRQLVHDAGLDQAVMASSPQAAKPYIYHRGRLVAAPRSPQTLLATPLLSPWDKLRLLGEPFAPRRADHEEEESVGAFVRRRAGAGVLAAMVAPLVSGIFAGDAERLSLQGAFPAAARMEQEHGSVLRGAMAQRGKVSARGDGPARARQSVGFRGGNDTLPRTLAARLGTNFTVRAKVEALWQRGQWMELLVGGQAEGRVVAKSVVLATPADATADLLDALEPAASKALREIEHPPVVQIALAYPRSAVGVALDGFGFLASRTQGEKVLGCVWNSSMFGDRCPDGEVLVTAFLGGATDPGVWNQRDDELVRLAHGDLARIMRIRDATPRVIAGFRWQHAIPQYNLGHSARLRTVEASLARLPHVKLCGNYLRGPSVPDCVALAREVAVSL